MPDNILYLLYFIIAGTGFLILSIIIYKIYICKCKCERPEQEQEQLPRYIRMPRPRMFPMTWGCGYRL